MHSPRARAIFSLRAMASIHYTVVVGNQGAKFNMFKNKDTGEIVLIGIKKAIEIATGLFLKK